MLPNINARQMQQAMKRMGIQQTDIDAVEVIIRCPDRNIIIKDPSVQKVNMMGQKSYQISGEEIEEASQDEAITISEEDIATVAGQAGVSEDDARKALEESNGDIAEAILKLKGE